MTLRKREYTHHFPVGVYILGDVQLLLPTGIVNAQANYNTAWRPWRNSSDLGLRENGLPYPMNAGAQVGTGTATSEFIAGTEPILPALETDKRGGQIRVIQGVFAEAEAVTFFADVTPTVAEAEVAAQAIIDREGAYTSIMGWHIADDVASGSRHPQGYMLANAFQKLDQFERPAVYVSPANNLIWSSDADLRVAATYAYPCGVRPSGTAAPEGDFHRSTFSTVTDRGGGGGDWVDQIRDAMEELPTTTPCWWFLQCHGNVQLGQTGQPTTAVRLPTIRELRTQFWILVGEAAKGIFFFEGTSSSGLADGIFDPDKADYREVAASLSSRLTGSMRKALMRCYRITTPFTASGGGSTGYDINYANAYISTIQHRDTGKKYVTIANRSTSSAAITINSSTVTGHLVNMETKTRIGIGTAVTIPALDGTIFEVDEIIGVPRWDPDEGSSVETFWTSHWANPASTRYLTSAKVQLHANQVSVTTATIQAAINAATGPTTFLLAAGTYGSITITGKSNLHFVAANIAARPTFSAVKIWGHAFAEHYHGPTTGASWKSYVNMLAQNDAAYVAAWFSPIRDIIFRSIDWVGEGTTNPVQYGWEQGSDGIWYNNHYLNSPIFMRTIRDVLIEDCTFDNYYMANDNNVGLNTDPRVAYDVVDPPSGHPGLVTAGSYNRNVVVRNCTLSGAPSGGFGFPYAVYFDGGVGNVVVSNTINDKWNGGHLLLLCNDDHSRDQDRDGRIKSDSELFDGRFNVFALNTASGAPGSCLITGSHNLCASNTYTGVINKIAVIEGRVTSNAYLLGRYYECYGNIIRDNTSSSSVAVRGVEVITTSCFAAAGEPSVTSRYRCRIGKTTVTNNAFTACPTWYTETGTGGAGYADGPDVVTGNTP